MAKPCFSWEEARVLAHADSPEALRLNLHRWAKAGDLVRLRRGVYAFPHRPPSLPEVIAVLYPPAYISLESALQQHGLLPDVPFETTLVTPRATRMFATPQGRFRFHRIDRRLFFGFDSRTLLAEPEKAVLDYFYLRGSSLKPEPRFWKEARFQNLGRLRWPRGDRMARAFPADRAQKLWKSLKSYAKAHRRA
jgi:hypothetical protein